MRRLALVAAAVLVAVGLFVLAVHTPPVRRLVLRYVVAEVQRRYGIRIEAARLDYNLPALTIGLSQVRIAAERTPTLPFFEADYIRAALASRALTGIVAFDEVAVTNGHVRLTRDRDGRMNLPDSSETPAGEPAPLNIAHLSAPRFVIDITDAQNDLALAIPGLTLDIGRSDGSMMLAAPATLTVGNNRTQVTTLEGGASFDGRALKLTAVTLRSPEATLGIDGVLSLLVKDPAVDVHATGTADVERLARWGIAEGERPRGTVALDVRATGPFASPAADVRATSSSLSIPAGADLPGGADPSGPRLVLTDIALTSHVTADQANIEDAHFTIAGGRVEAKGEIPFAGADAHLNASWQGIDATTLTTVLAGPIEMAPTGALSGQLSAVGPLAEIAKWSADVTLRADGGSTRRGRIAIPGTTRLQLADGRWRIDARHRAGNTLPVALVAAGELNTTTPGNSTLSGRLDIPDTNIPPLLRLLRTLGVAEVDEDIVSGGTVSAAVTLGGRLARPTVDANVHALDLAGMQFSIGELRANASGELTTPRLTFTADAPSAVIADEQVSNLRLAGQLDGNVLAVQTLTASQAVRGGELSASGTYNLRTEQDHATLSVARWTVAPTADRPLAAQLDGTFTGTGSLNDPHGMGTLRATNLSWDGTSPGDIEADVQLDGTAANIDARAPELNSRVTARVGVRAPYQTSVDLRADNVDLARLIPPAASPTPLTGHVTLAAHSDLPLAEWRQAVARVDVTSLDAAAGDLPITLAEPAHLRLEGQRLRVDTLEVNAGMTRLSASGDLPLMEGIPGGVRDSGSGIQLTANGDIGEAVRAVAAAGLADLPITEGAGPLAMRARVTGTLEKPLIAADLDAGPGSLTIKDLSTATDLRLRAHLENDVVDVREAHTVYEGAVLDATGSIPLAVVNSTSTPPPSTAAPASLHATVKGLTPAVLRGLLDPTTLEDLAGTVDAAVNVETPSTDLARAIGDLTLTRLDLQVAGLPVTQRVPTRIVLRDGFARIESWNWSGTGATLGVFGQVRLADRQAAIIANGDIDLRMLTPFVRSAGMSTAGRLTPKLSITGPLDAPRIDGDVALDGGEVRLIDPRVIVTGLTARAALTRTDMTLRALNGSINGGTLTGDGNVSYQPDTGLNVHLSADVREMALDFPVGLRSQLNAMLQLDAVSEPDAVAPSGRLSGTITVLRGAYREPLAVVGGLLAAVRARNVAATGASSEDTAFLKQLALDISVVTDEDLIVDNNYARAQLGADLDVIGTAAAPGLSGRAVLREDGQIFVGRNVYTISHDTPSTIDFVSPTAIEPELNIHLTTRVSGHDIELALTGPAESPQVDMTAEDLGQADVTALLLTGRTLDQLGTADASFIGTQVIGNFSGEVLGFAGRAVGLDTLRIGGVDESVTRLEPTAVATEVDPTSRLTFGKGIGSNVDLTFSQSLRDSTAQTWIVDYLPVRQIDMRVVSDDDDLRRYGFRHDLSFGGGTVPTGTRTTTEPRAEQHVGDVSVTGQLAFPEERIRALLKLRPGNTFDFARWQDDRDRVEDFYHQNGHLAARVSAAREVSGDVVNLAFAIDAGPQTAIEVTGVEVGRDVSQQIADAWASSVLDELLVDEATQILRIELARQGYVRPQVSARIVSEGDMKTLRVEVQPGDRSTETRVRVVTSDQAVLADLEARVAERRLADRILSDPGSVTRDLTDFLRSRGYLRASVTPAPALIEGGAAVLPITVDPGPQFVLAEIAFEGRRNVPEEDVARAIDVTAGSPYNPAAIDTARERIVAVFRSHGFASATVTANGAIRDTEPRVDLTFEIAEGFRQTIGDVVVSGNGGVDPDVVTRALDLTVGSTLDPTELLRARTRVFGTGLFRRVDVTTEGMDRLSASDPNQPMRIRVAVEAWPALRLRYGFEVAEEHPESNPTGRALAPGLTADLTRRTLFGRAVSLTGVVQYERRQNTTRGLVNAPTLMALPIQSSLVLERVHQATEGTSFVSNRNGVSWEQRVRRADSNLTLSYSYRFDRDHTFDTRPDTGSGLDFDITVNVARLIGNAAWDTRDDPLNTTRGSLYSSSLQWAPDSLGSQFRFLKYVGQAYHFRNVHGIVLASAARLGAVGPLGGQDLLFSERFLAGGSRTVRGVDENNLGPRDFLGEPTGGQVMLVLNQEARVPIYKWVGGVAFIDSGNVFPQPRDFSFSELTTSVGAGIRLNTPFALLRADYGRVPWPGTTTTPAGAPWRAGRWFFGIGQAF